MLKSLHALTPSQRLRIALAGFAYVVVTLTAAAIYLRIVPSPDHSTFDYLAWLNLHGVPLYEEAFDMTWPGQVVFHQLSIMTFGVHSWTARAGDLILLQPAVLAIFAFLWRCGFRAAAVAAALLYPLIYVTSGAWMTGLRDFTGTHFLIGAAVFALPAARRVNLRWFMAGLLVGYATMIRPTYLAAAPLLFLLDVESWKSNQLWSPTTVKRGLAYGIGLFAPVLTFALYGIATQTLDDWYLGSVRFVTDVYGGMPESRWRLLAKAASVIRSLFWWLAIVGTIGAVLWAKTGRAKQGLWLLGAIAATIAISYVVQNKGFGYHIAGLIPLLLICACAGAEAGIRVPVRLNPVANAAVGAIAALLLAGTSLRLVHAIPKAPDWGRDDQTMPLANTLALARIIRAESAPADTLLQWGWEYQVSFLSERPSPTRLINTTAARQIGPGQPIFGEWLSEFRRELTARPPKFVLVDESVILPGTTIFSTTPVSRQGSMLDILRRWVSQGYVIRAQRGNVTLLKRADCHDPAAEDCRRFQQPRPPA